MGNGRKWRRYPETRPEAFPGTFKSGLCWITVEYTEGAHKGERVVAIAVLTNIDYPGFQQLWEYGFRTNPHCNLVDHYGSGRKVVAWKPFDFPEPYADDQSEDASPKA